MEDLKRLLERKVVSINQDPEKREKIRRWVDGYRGKVISFKTKDESFHLIFEKDKVTLNEGNYSSCEFSYIGSKEVLCAILRKEESAMRAGMSGIIKGWGSVNEALKFEKII